MIVLPYLGKLSLQIRNRINRLMKNNEKFFYVLALLILKVRIAEYLGVSALTGKRVKGDNDSAIKEHHLFYNHSSGFDNFSILASNNDFKVTLMENLLINRDHPPLNKNRHSLSLGHFDD